MIIVLIIIISIIFSRSIIISVKHSILCYSSIFYSGVKL